MKDLREQVSPSLGLRALVRDTSQWFASTQLAVILMVVVAAVLAVATVLESSKGREYAQWHVYKSPWFMALLGMLALNILAATLARFPWPRGRRGFLLAHAGVLVLMAGALLTFMAGVEGHLALEEGQSGNTFVNTDLSQLKTAWSKHENHLFNFEPGPTNWPENRTMDLGRRGGVHLELLKFYRHARAEEEWVEDPSATGNPAFQVALANPDGTPMIEQWLVADPFADDVFLGPVKLTFQRVTEATMLDDFANPPNPAKDADGILSVHCDGRMVRLPVRENIGKKVAVGKGEIQVEISSYFPDAKPDASAHFTTASQKPNNPLLDLKVYTPGKDQPLRQIAFAKHPFLNLDAMHGRDCPVKFWYHHPAIVPEAGTQFLQTPDGKLHYRVIADGKRVAGGEVKEGTHFEMAHDIRLSISKYLPHARHEVRFVPVNASARDDDAEESAVLVKVQAGGKDTEVWLNRDDPVYGFQKIATPEGALGIAFGYDRLPLEFSLKLVSFQHSLNPGMMGDASFASLVEVIDKSQGINMPAEIAMNKPLDYGGFTFYQSGHNELPGGRQVSILAVSFDPGRFMKYLGSVMICLGVFIVVYKKTLFSFVARLAGRRSATNTPNAAGPTAKNVILAFFILTAGAAGAFAGENDAATFDWRSWRCLPVQDGGRQKPLDALARETIRSISNKSSFVDPRTHENLDAVALYLVLLFEGQGWDRPASPHAMPGAASCPGQSASPKPDAWDREPLLSVDSSELRAALGLPADQNLISFVDLGRVEITPPDTDKKDAFLAWAKQIASVRPQDRKPLERRALDLAERYWTYQDLRRGRKLEILPVKDSKGQEWISAAILMQTKWDDESDPSGEIRAAKEHLQKARGAYLAGSAGAFNAASAAFIAALRKIGPQLGDYPSAEMIDCEVAYNHWAPFRVAWICALLAVLGMFLSWASRWRPFRLAGLAFYSASVLAMLVAFGMRVIIAARAPVTNMYESVVFVALGTALFGIVCLRVYRKDFVLMAAAAVSALTLALADACFDPSLQPLPPVLRSNFWLITHVSTIMLSYAAFALAWLIGNITLGFYLAHRGNHDSVGALTKLTYLFLRAGLLLLLIGTLLGAWWADYAWGRFWGWDPKEVWALITLLLYLALLHARLVGWVGELGVAALSVVCFTSILMAWYGVNYVLAAGLHSYGFGGGGQNYVLAAVALQFLDVGVAAIRGAGEACSSAPSSSQA